MFLRLKYTPTTAGARFAQADRMFCAAAKNIDKFASEFDWRRLNYRARSVTFGGVVSNVSSCDDGRLLGIGDDDDGVI